MYRRYEPQRKSSPPPQNIRHNGQHNNSPPQDARQKAQAAAQRPKPKENKEKKEHPLTKFIPQSVYDPKSGKILGFLSAEDLLLVALILLMIDAEDNDADNSMLVYALIYILISEHIDLPF